jgi:N-acetyl-anhydromuramyl-L-alanine amidase AmpD
MEYTITTRLHDDDNTPITVVDGRHIWTPQKLWKRGIVRPWVGDNRIRGVTLHQTACHLGERPERWARIGAHCGVTRQGVVILMQDFQHYIWHAQGLSRQTIGIEIDGRYLGIEGNPKTIWPKGTTLDVFTEIQRKACDILMTLIFEECEDNGGNFDRIHAHRQSSTNRMSDPGEAIWRGVALPWMHLLGATDGGPEWKTGSGRPIPREWNEDYPTRFFA